MKRDGWQDMMSGMATQFIFMFLRNCNEYYGTNKNSDTSKPDKLVQSALEYIWIHYGENIQNTVIAELLNVSPNYLTKIFAEIRHLTAQICYVLPSGTGTGYAGIRAV